MTLGRLLFPLAFVVCAVPLQAIDPSPAITQYVHRAWRTEDGLPQITAMALAQTPDGYLWIGTNNGLARFDGVRFTVYNRTNTPELRDNAITALRTGGDGTLWIGTVAGVVTLRGDRFQSLGAREGLPSAPVYALYESHDGEIWVGCPGAVYHGRGGRFAERKLPIPGDVLSFAEAEGSLWIAAYGGLLRLTPASIERFTSANGLPADNVLSVCAVGDALWIGTTHGMVRRHAGAFDRDLPPELQTAEVWSMLLDRHGTLWIGTRSGLLRLRGGALAAYTQKEGLSNDAVDSLLEDREGSLWVGTHLGGLNHFHDGLFTTCGTAEGLKADVVWSIVDDPQAGLWIGMEGGGAALLQNGRVQPSGIPTRSVTAVTRTADGTLWAGTWSDGLLHPSPIAGLPDKTVTSLEADGNAVWAGTAHGLARVDGGRATKVAVPGDYILATHRDRAGRVWVAMDAGLCVLSGDRCESRFGGQPLPSKPVYAIHEDREGLLWFGTRAGLFLVTPGGTTRLLGGDRIFHIEEDRDGDFWLVSPNGIFTARRADLLRGQIPNGPFFGIADGMKSAEVTYGINPSTAAARDGSIWFPTVRGAARLDPAAAKRGGGALLVPRIEEVIADGRPARGPLDLVPGTEKLEFHYSAPSFVAPEQIRFRYRLAGYDRDWIDAGARRVAYYTHLPAGRYEMQVMAGDRFGHWTPAVRLPMRLQPRFTETIGFDLLVLALVGALALAIYAARVRRIRKQHEAVLAERNRIAREFHDTLAQSLVAISQQLQLAERSDDRAALGLARHLVRESLKETRRSLLGLRPEVLERAGLPAAIEAMAAHARGVSNIDVVTTVEGPVRQLDADVEQNILRIAQEALTNAIRHSGARSIHIALLFDNADVELSIADDGRGLPSRDSGPLQLGLVGIRERALAIGGEVEVMKNAASGTTIRLVVRAPEGVVVEPP